MSLWHSAFASRDTYNPNDPCFDWKRPSFGGLKPQDRGQTCSRYKDVYCTGLFCSVHRPRNLENCGGLHTAAVQGNPPNVSKISNPSIVLASTTKAACQACGNHTISIV